MRKETRAFVMRTAIIVWLAQSCVFCPGCDGGGSDAESDTDADADADTDADSDADDDTPGPALGEPVSGQFHLGPVEWEGSFWNSCAPYPAEIQALEGELLTGLGMNYNGEGQLCDACILVETAAGKSATLRVVTTGATNEPGDIDVSSAAYALLDSGEYPRTMTWKLVTCPDTGSIYYQFQTEASAWWTSFWVRDQKLPLEKVEVRSANHADFTALRLGTDGTFNDDGGFGEGEFTLRLTAITGETLEDTFASFAAGDLLESPAGQFGE
jgi:expansin (peptidoglycan-binding protein)